MKGSPFTNHDVVTALFNWLDENKDEILSAVTEGISRGFQQYDKDIYYENGKGGYSPCVENMGTIVRESLDNYLSTQGITGTR